MILGYARVSTDGQAPGPQVEQLTAAGAEKVYRETASGAKRDRAQLARLPVPPWSEDEDGPFVFDHLEPSAGRDTGHRERVLGTVLIIVGLLCAVVAALLLLG